MNQLAAKWIVPFYVFLCLVVGGSNRGIWGSAVLQVGAALLIGFAAVFAKPRDLPRSARLLLILVIASLLLAVLQLAPLSPEIWTQLPGRAPIREGYEALEASLPWLPLSLTPEVAWRCHSSPCSSRSSCFRKSSFGGSSEPL